MLKDRLAKLLCFINQDKEKWEIMNAIIEKYSNEVQDGILTEEIQIEKILTLAKEAGIEVIPEKLDGQTLEDGNLLLDCELDEITGGRGQINEMTNHLTIDLRSCDKVANDMIFAQNYYYAGRSNQCPCFENRIIISDIKLCCICKNLKTQEFSTMPEIY
jgi:hypothetical protein